MESQAAHPHQEFSRVPSPPQVKIQGSHKETHSKLKANYNDNRNKPLQYCSIFKHSLGQSVKTDQSVLKMTSRPSVFEAKLRAGIVSTKQLAEQEELYMLNFTSKYEPWYNFVS